MLVVFVFSKLQDIFQGNKTAFRGIVLQVRSILETKKNPPPRAQERAGKCFQIGNGSGKTDEAVVFAVDFHVPGMCRVIQSGIVRMIGIREHAMGFFRVAVARSNIPQSNEDSFPGSHLECPPV